MQRDEQRSDVGPLGLVEDKTSCSILDHLKRFGSTCWKSGQKSIAVVKPRNDQGLDEELCCVLS